MRNKYGRGLLKAGLVSTMLLGSGVGDANANQYYRTSIDIGNKSVNTHINLVTPNRFVVWFDEEKAYYDVHCSSNGVGMFVHSVLGQYYMCETGHNVAKDNNLAEITVSNGFDTVVKKYGMIGDANAINFPFEEFKTFKDKDGNDVNAQYRVYNPGKIFTQILDGKEYEILCSDNGKLMKSFKVNKGNYVCSNPDVEVGEHDIKVVYTNEDGNSFVYEKNDLNLEAAIQSTAVSIINPYRIKLTGPVGVTKASYNYLNVKGLIVDTSGDNGAEIRVPNSVVRDGDNYLHLVTFDVHGNIDSHIKRLVVRKSSKGTVDTFEGHDGVIPVSWVRGVEYISFVENYDKGMTALRLGLEGILSGGKRIFDRILRDGETGIDMNEIEEVWFDIKPGENVDDLKYVAYLQMGDGWLLHQLTSEELERGKVMWNLNTESLVEGNPNSNYANLFRLAVWNNTGEDFVCQSSNCDEHAVVIDNLEFVDPIDLKTIDSVYESDAHVAMDWIKRDGGVEASLEDGSLYMKEMFVLDDGSDSELLNWTRGYEYMKVNADGELEFSLEGILAGGGKRMFDYTFPDGGLNVEEIANLEFLGNFGKEIRTAAYVLMDSGGWKVWPFTSSSLNEEVVLDLEYPPIAEGDISGSVAKMFRLALWNDTDEDWGVDDKINLDDMILTDYNDAVALGGNLKDSWRTTHITSLDGGVWNLSNVQGVRFVFDSMNPDVNFNTAIYFSNTNGGYLRHVEENVGLYNDFEVEMSKFAIEGNAGLEVNGLQISNFISSNPKILKDVDLGIYLQRVVLTGDAFWQEINE